MLNPRTFFGPLGLGQLRAMWQYDSNDDLEEVVSPGYFTPINRLTTVNGTAGVRESNVRKGDWIFVNAPDGATILVVTVADNSGVEVDFPVFPFMGAGAEPPTKE